MKKRVARVVLACALTASAASCAGGASQGSADPKDATTATAWKDMTKEQRAAYMKRAVLPRMRKAFIEFDRESYAEMNCAMCHGKGAEDRTFKMPNPDLPKLPRDPEGFARLEAKKPEAVHFMKSTVVPRMSDLLGEAPYDPATQTGFGCFRCHMTE